MNKRSNKAQDIESGLAFCDKLHYAPMLPYYPRGEGIGENGSFTAPIPCLRWALLLSLSCSKDQQPMYEDVALAPGPIIVVSNLMMSGEVLTSIKFLLTM